MDTIIDTLDKMAEKHIPEGVSNLFHVHCRTAWVEAVYELIESGHIQPTKDNIVFLARFWEQVLAKKFSTLN
jgi:hypothetical protein